MIVDFLVAFGHFAADNAGMSTLSGTDGSPVLPRPGAPRRQTPLRAKAWQSPLLNVALLWTAGIVLDRTIGLPLPAACLVVLVSLTAWTFAQNGRQGRLGLVYLAIGTMACGAAYHHYRRTVFAADDIGVFATADARPIHLRAWIEEEPTIHRQPPEDDLLSVSHADATIATLRVTELEHAGGWIGASGRARLTVAGHWQEAHVGDAVEVFGRLLKPQGPANPGEADYSASLLDRRIRALIVVRKTLQAVRVLPEKHRFSPIGSLMVIRAWAARVLQQRLSPTIAPVAKALLLGDTSDMTSADWDRYIETGVVHVLAISGQHLVILAGSLWWLCRLVTIRRRHIAWLVAGFLLLYALMTGGRPPILRAAVMVCACCGGLYLRRPALSANTLALGWIIVSLVNPADLASVGCQLSFVAVAVLCWGPWHWFPRAVDPLDQLIEKSLPPWRRRLLLLGRGVGFTYVITWVVWLSAAPLVAAHTHLFSPIGLLIGPIVMLVTSVALISGFFLLALAALCPFLIAVVHPIVQGSLTVCGWFVRVADGIPGGHIYVGDVPAWWLWGFYIGLFALLTVPAFRIRWRWAMLALVAWFCIGQGSGLARNKPLDEFRCTFLAVGRGGCTVLELPDGRTILYDTGAMAGPALTQRQVAPYLWQRGIHRLDEIWLSHADLDHFNGLPALLERFAVGQISLTPSFADKRTAGVRATLKAIEHYRVPVRIIHAGQRLDLGAVHVDILHPPPRGPDGNENARSLVLLVRHAGHTILLTGDLEGPGLLRVLSLPAPRIDILMAPHHGSHVANTPGLADWAKPRMVIASQGPPVWPRKDPDPYEQRHIPYLGTWPQGAVTIRSRPGQLRVETFRTGQRIALDAPEPR